MHEQERMTDHTPQLAETLGMGVEEFELLLGACWELDDGPISHDFDSDPSGGAGHDVTPWHVQGVPAQLMARVFGHGVFLALPRARFDGPAPAGFEPAEQVYIAVHEMEDEAPPAVRRILTRRRRSFRWCARCRHVTALEYMVGDRCPGCSGVDF